ncbi:hypothetical protein AWF78_22590, partial [Escherichia coli]
MEKNEVKTTLRYPYRFKEEVKRIAKEEGMSENSVLVQGLAWWLKYREKMRNLCGTEPLLTASRQRKTNVYIPDSLT